MPAVTQQRLQEIAIEEELIRLRLARLKLKHFIRYVYPTFPLRAHHEFLCEKLEQVERYITTGGKEGIGKLMIWMPPRHGKSFLCSQALPAWLLGRNPDKRVIITSYGAFLAEGFSHKVRSCVESTEFQKVFGKLASRSTVPESVNVAPDRRSAQSWDLDGHRGGLGAAGVGGPILGTGCELLVIDDPLKGDEEADSEVQRQNVIDWYTSTALSRVHTGGAIIVIMQRWHEEDLAGWLHATEPNEWTLVNLPAISTELDDPMGRKEGEVLWPEDGSSYCWPLETLLKKKAIMPPRFWNALYQQTPSGEAGEVFNGDWLVYGTLPDPQEIVYGVQAWDTAMTEKDSSDYSVCVTAFVTKAGVFVADVFRKRMGFPELKQRMHELHDHWSRHYRISRIYIENRVSGTSVLQSLKKEGSLPVIATEPDSKRGKSKRQRAEAAAGYFASGRVVFQKGAPWLHDLESEMMHFPHGKHDDQVDALCSLINQVHGGGARKAGALMKARDEWLQPLSKMTRHQQIMGGL